MTLQWSSKMTKRVWKLLVFHGLIYTSGTWTLAWWYGFRSWTLFQLPFFVCKLLFQWSWSSIYIWRYLKEKKERTKRLITCALALLSETQSPDFFLCFGNSSTFIWFFFFSFIFFYFFGMDWRSWSIKTLFQVFDFSLVRQRKGTD
jgi:hypothetical protein